MTSPQIDIGRQRAEIAHRRQLALHIVGRRAHHHPQEGQATFAGQPTDDAEVEQRGATVGEHEQIAAVQVAMEHPVDHRSLDQGDHRRADDRLGVDTGALHPCDVIEVEPVDALHHQHPASHQRCVGAGHDVPGLLQLVEHDRDVDHVGSFHAEVELLDDRLGEQLDQRGRIGQ